MAVRIKSTALLGVEAVGVGVETQIIGTLRRFSLVGLPDGVLREAKDRVRCAISNSGFDFPYQEVVVSLSPASLPKAGSGFDLAIALGILAADGQVDPAGTEHALFLGELSLDGMVKAVPGILAAARYAKGSKISRLVVADAGARLASHVEGIEVIAVSSLLEAVSVANKKVPPRLVAPQPYLIGTSSPCVGTFGDVVGQHAAKRALEIAAAGGHNVLMVGPPGSGKSMLAKRVPAILPSLSLNEALEVSQVYDAAGASLALSGGQGMAVKRRALNAELVTMRPFRAPHHSTSTAGLIGGGSRPRPGEISLAHRGVLFLDEFTELRRDSLESLREPLENKQIVISRAQHRTYFPADFILIAAMNPCPCGNYSLNTSGEQRQNSTLCQCSPNLISRYRSRVSGPILDRMDLQLWISQVPVNELSRSEMKKDPTSDMGKRVALAREIQKKRLKRLLGLNATMTAKEIELFCKLQDPAKKLLCSASKRFNLSARGYTRVLKVARTIADLSAQEQVLSEHVAEALSYRLAF